VSAGCAGYFARSSNPVDGRYSFSRFELVEKKWRGRKLGKHRGRPLGKRRKSAAPKKGGVATKE
jgi:hypothetical protein